MRAPNPQPKSPARFPTALPIEAATALRDLADRIASGDIGVWEVTTGDEVGRDGYAWLEPSGYRKITVRYFDPRARRKP